MAAFVATSEEAGSACPAGGGCNERVFKAHSLCSEAIKVRGLDHRMTSAPEGMVALVVSEQEKYVRLTRAGSWKECAKEKNAERRHGV